MEAKAMWARRVRWLLASALAVSTQLLVASPGMSEEDHLMGYKIKDLNQVPGLSGVQVEDQFGNETCDLKKPQFFLVQGEKNGLDDSRGGPAGHFVCYKAKCEGALPPVTGADSQAGIHSLEIKKAKLVCLPVDQFVCGDGDIDPGETCDGSDDTACPGDCLPDCTCASCPASGGDASACAAYSVFQGQCWSCCHADPQGQCPAPCDSATLSSCGESLENDLCSSALNAAGCAAECCP